jgi:hypothetical protein
MKMDYQQWLTEGLLDSEWKRYRLLALLQQAAAEFEAQRLFPVLPQLELQLQALQEFDAAYRQLEALSPKTLTALDLKNARALYLNANLPVSKEMEHCKEMANFAIPLIQEQVEEGRKIFRTATNELTLNTIGLAPLDVNSGYVMLHPGDTDLVLVYAYLNRMIQGLKQGLYYIHLEFICSYRLSIMNTYEKLRWKLIRYFHHYNSPATWLIESPQDVPLQQLLLPAVRQKLQLQLLTTT